MVASMEIDLTPGGNNRGNTARRQARWTSSHFRRRAKYSLIGFSIAYVWASLAQHVLFPRHQVELEWAFRSSRWTNQPGLAMRGMFDGRLERPAARSLEYDRIATIPSDFAATCRSQGCFSSAPSCRSHEGLRSAFTCPLPAWSSSKEK